MTEPHEHDFRKTMFDGVILDWRCSCGAQPMDWIGSLTRPAPEIQLADALLACEPPKVEGGSPQRRAWLGLVMTAEQFVLEHGLDFALFATELLGKPWTGDGRSHHPVALRR